MMKERKGDQLIRTACGKEGKPYGFDKRGVRSTVWPSGVTCPVCRATAGVRGPQSEPLGEGEEPHDPATCETCNP